MVVFLGIVMLMCVSMVTCDVPRKRNIVLITADDLGWNDIGFHNKDIKTPVLDKLALNGVILNQLYAQPMCTPSRTALMTGLYPFRVGQQGGVICTSEPRCAAPGHTFLSQKLKLLGYSTHLVGKWHLGMCSWNCTPTYRGFDSYYGYYHGAQSYFTKEFKGGVDFRDGEKPIKTDEYSTYLFRDRAVDIIHNHNNNNSLFLFLSFQAPHTPLEVPKKYEQLYPDIKSKNRRLYSGMISAMDEAIGKVQEALEDTGLLDDTLIIFSSDNGGFPSSTGNNLPLRGAKGTVFEGGTRVASFVTGSGLKNTSYTYNGLMHFTDWFPTILEAAGDSHCEDDKIDGISQWRAIMQGGESPRHELVYNVDLKDYSAIRVGDYKLIQGYPGPFRDWYQVGQEFRPDLVPLEGDDEIVTTALVAEDRENSPDVFDGVQLYNIQADQGERVDISERHPDIVAQLSEKLDSYRKVVVPRPDIVKINNADPQHHDGIWTPGWC